MECYRYDLHVHTKEASACAQSTGAEMAEMYKSEGYTGIFITDHFYHGNTAVPRDLPWEEWIERFTLGYRHAKETGDRIGLDVFFAWEYSYAGTDFLTFGLDADWLLAHPDVRSWHVTEYFKEVHAAGGFLSHAHPFLEASYVPYIRLMPQYEDGVEVINASKTPFVNGRAAEYASAYDKILTAGSDAHNKNWPALAGIETSRRITSAADLVETLRKREHTVFRFERTLN